MEMAPSGRGGFLLLSLFSEDLFLFFLDII
jgi:hypothetical protein